MAAGFVFGTALAAVLTISARPADVIILAEYSGTFGTLFQRLGRSLHRDLASDITLCREQLLTSLYTVLECALQRILPRRDVQHLPVLPVRGA